MSVALRVGSVPPLTMLVSEDPRRTFQVWEIALEL